MSQNKKPAKAPSAYSNHFEAMKTLAKCRGIHPTCKLVLLDILAHVASKGGIAYPSQATIAKNIGYSTRQVQRAIAGLAQVQAITIVYQTKQAVRGRARCWQAVCSRPINVARTSSMELPLRAASSSTSR